MKLSLPERQRKIREREFSSNCSNCRGSHYVIVYPESVQDVKASDTLRTVLKHPSTLRQVMILIAMLAKVTRIMLMFEMFRM